MNEEVIVYMRTLYPPLVSQPDEVLNAWVEVSKLFVCFERFGDKKVQALAFYTLHLVSQDIALKTQNDSSQTSSDRVKSYSLSGEYTITYDTSTATKSSSDLSSSSWGKLYLALYRKKLGGWGLIMGKSRGCC
ncbi:virion structural protein [Escherichia phage Phagiculus]